MRDALIAALKTRRGLGLSLLGLGVFAFSVSFHLGLASGDNSAVQRPVASRAGNRTDVSREVAAGGWEIAGVVLDSHATPISNAPVFSWNARGRIYAQTDKAGHFKLSSMPGEGAHVYVQADGFRFYGISIASSTKTIRIALTRTSEPATRILQTLPVLPSLRKAFDSVSSDFGPFAKARVAAAEKTDRLRPLEVLASVEPAWVLQYLQANGFENPWFSDYVRWAAAEVLLDQNMEDALAIVHSLEGPMWRAMGCMKVANALPDAQRAQKLSLLAEALLQAHAIEAPDKQLSILSTIAGHFLDLGQTEEATRILREGHKTAKTLPTKEWPGYARGCLAEKLARIDLTAAMALVAGYEDDFDHDRHHGNIAHALAARDPAGAQRVLNMMRTKHNRDQWSSRLCYHLASPDTDRAREIAMAIETPCIRAHALGMMALALSDSDKSLASTLVQEAFAQLDELVIRKSVRGTPHPQDVALSLLPVVESIDAECVDEYLWHALSLDEGPRALTAACVARYDREMAARWLPPDKPEEFRQSGSYYVALALLDPEASVRLAKELPETSEDDQKTKMQVWTWIVGMLKRDTQERWEWIQESQMRLWYVGKEDI